MGVSGCVVCGGVVLPGQVACRDCVEYSFEAVGWPLVEGVMVGDNRDAWCSTLQEYKDTMEMARERISLQEAKIEELQAECDALETRDALAMQTRNLVIAWVALTVMFFGFAAMVKHVVFDRN